MLIVRLEDSAFSSFFFDSTGRFFWPVAGLTPETFWNSE
jgi:hypothetical protein